MIRLKHQGKDLRSRAPLGKTTPLVHSRPWSNADKTKGTKWRRSGNTAVRRFRSKKVHRGWGTKTILRLLASHSLTRTHPPTRALLTHSDIGLGINCVTSVCSFLDFPRGHRWKLITPKIGARNSRLSALRSCAAVFLRQTNESRPTAHVTLTDSIKNLPPRGDGGGVARSSCVARLQLGIITRLIIHAHPKATAGCVPRFITAC